jgi:hypothetical protein
MASIKCPGCGLTNFDTEPACRRCGGSLAPPPMDAFGQPPVGNWQDPYGSPPSPYGYGDPAPPDLYGAPPPDPYGYGVQPPPNPYGYGAQPPPNPYGYGPQPPPPPPYGAQPPPPPPYGYGAQPGPGVPFGAPGVPYGLPHPGTGWAPAAGVWQSGSLLIMAKESPLPPRCVRCNAPAEGLRVKRKLTWYPPMYQVLAVLLFVFLRIIGMVIFWLVAMRVRKTATVYVPLCERHRTTYKVASIAGPIVIIAGFFMLGFAIAFSSNFIFLALPLILVGLIGSIISLRTIFVQKIDDEYVQLKKVNKQFLAELPYWPGPTP